jgi:AcrR family transcriptional regulator
MRTAQRSAARRGPTRSRAEQGRETRAAILRAAVELYAGGGYRGTGLIAIGQRAGVHHATVLYHFRTGKELLLAVLEEHDRQYLELTGDVLREGGLVALRNLPLAGRFNAEHPMWAKLFTVLQVENLDADAEANAFFVKRRRATHGLIRRLLREAKERRETRAEVDAPTTADVVLAFMTGVRVQYFLDPGRVDLVGSYERFTTMLLADLAPRR